MERERRKFSLNARFSSFTFAFSGLRLLVRYEHNAWLHAVASVFVVTTGVILQVNNNDWRWLITAIALVWMAEAFNTAIERLCDVVTVQKDEGIRVVKDMAAGGVLICSVASAAIGGMVFLPYVIHHVR